jgi:sulfur carrier protein
MNVVLNGREHPIGAPISVAALLEETGYAQRRIAVEINREIVPRSQYGARMLSAGDRVEIVQAIGGG